MALYLDCLGQVSAIQEASREIVGNGLAIFRKSLRARMVLVLVLVLLREKGLLLSVSSNFQ